MLSLLAATAAVSEAIQWAELGLRPYLFEIGGFQLRYYSLAYLFGILLGYWHLSRMIKSPGSPMAQRHADDLFFYCTLGVILGGRLGYAAFYKPDLLTSIELFKLWGGGMSFHGGVIGVLVAITWVARRGNLNWLRVCDYIAVNVPLAYMLGRIANFINGELYGRPVESDVAWAMVFPGGGDVARHPSQLYQAGLEGLMLGVVLIALFWLTRARYRPGLLVGLFTVGMGVGRFVNEFFREPDAHLAYVVAETGLSRGQWLSLPMIAVGLAVMIYAFTRKPIGTTKAPAAQTA
ncbi:prolipoprotein diacylglyceryl transferase [Qipengyuania nanhaisediminis]|uniref:Phosphatidylglycerol--prolipoprotein diacylglyceryl transferase n=1 Tax=Qipengyuania nanhaisediminis TaxID=604088 RepID=A0A1I5KL46_9SPHN|nr:prolipoprotein diacylglyceryl transferase [Qipengyuania nanhaisediminis]SFO85261.1 phosphatidylglycerol:prolipoprotein diacylglycerol transferase [Qipengyuania nanhaisediminis]